MLKEISASLRMLLAMTVALGLVYPLAMTAFAQVVFPSQANGSLLYDNGRAVGSKLIGQNFADSVYFQGRPSSAGDGYDAANSSGSNLGPTSKKLIDNISERAVAIRESNGLDANTKVPSDLVTASGSGLDPHITPAGAALQIQRVARARGISEEVVKAAVAKNTENPQAGFLGDQRVNVLMLNLELDQLMK